MVSRNPADLARWASINSRMRLLLESGVLHQPTASTDAGRTFVKFTCAPDVPCRFRNDGRATRCNENGHTCAGAHALERPAEPFRGAGEFLDAVRRMAADYKSIASAAFRSQAESACRQYRVVRWFLLPEAELRRRLMTR